MSKKIIIAMMGLILLCPIYLNSFAQSYDSEVLTMFIRGTVEFPEGETTAEIGDIGFTPSDLKDIIIGYSGETMTVAFPDYRREDSIFVSVNLSRLRVVIQPELPGVGSLAYLLDLVVF